MSSSFTVLVVSTNERFKEVMSALLARSESFVLRGSVSHPDEITILPGISVPDVIISDQPPSDAHEVISWRTIRESGSRLLMLTRYMGHSIDVMSLLAGASGLILVPERHLVDAIKRVANGELIRSQQLSGYLSAVVSGEAPSRLDGEERGILRLIIEGSQDEEIASQFNTTSVNVRDQIARIAEKLV